MFLAIFKRLFLSTVCFFSAIGVTFSDDSFPPDPKLFPTSEFIDSQVYFWKKIFANVSVDAGVFHDKQMVLPIYHEMSVAGLSRRQAERRIEKEKKKIRQQLNNLAMHLERDLPLNDEETALLNLFYEGITPKELRAAGKRIRFQTGIRETFKAGIIRSGAYIDYIHNELEKHGLPLALAHLPHVESSFNLGAHSRSGAKGIWQFTRGTGREYMRVNSFVDERRDPLIATRAAVKLLKRNYEMLGSWPLAITAYNYGHNGLRRIVKKLGTNDLSHLIQNHQSRSFSFASKNFYAEFLAAWEVAANAEHYFGSFEKKPPLSYSEVDLPSSIYFQDLVELSDFTKEELKFLNPALKPSVLKGHRPIPSYYTLKTPPMGHRDVKEFEAALKRPLERQSVASRQGTSGLERIVVQKGDSLYTLSRRYDIPMRTLAHFNGIRLHQPIYPNQILYIPPGATMVFQGRHVVVVQPGDSLYGIAKRIGISLNQLMHANGLSHTDIIYPGQQLVLNF